MKTALRPRNVGGGAVSADFCYEQWLKHLAFLSRKSGIRTHPKCIAELGPGRSIGTGLTGLLTGAECLITLDVRDWTDRELNLSVFRELVPMVRERASRKFDGWPGSREYLGENQFPCELVSQSTLKHALADRRVQHIEELLKGSSSSERAGICIRTIAPWNEASAVGEKCIDFVFSHAVLEHLEDPAATYRCMNKWIKPGGYMSHHIDLSAHGLSKKWNGHWTCSDYVWKLVRGKRPYLINRHPVSVHEKLVRESGFEVTYTARKTMPSAVSRNRLRGKWYQLSEEDLTCAAVFLQARKLKDIE